APILCPATATPLPYAPSVRSYAGFGGGFALGPTRLMSQGVYRIPKFSFGSIAALTNTTPTGAFRGAGRPEAAAMVERIIDVGAADRKSTRLNSSHVKISYAVF